MKLAQHPVLSATRILTGAMFAASTFLVACASNSAVDAQNQVDDEPRVDGGSEELTWYCSGEQETCRCLRASVDAGFVFSSNEVEGCWDYDCCMLIEDEDYTTCECRMTDSSSACQERVEATRNARIVSECAPGAERDLSRYAAAGERCDRGYLANNELWACTPGTECLTNADGLSACREITDAILECRAAVGDGTPNLRLTEPVTVAASGATTEVSVVAGEVEVNENGCLTAFDLNFEGDDPVCELRLTASVQDESFNITEVTSSIGFCAPPDAPPLPYISEDDPTEIPFRVAKVFGETCDTGTEHCLIGGFEVLLSGTLSDVTFEETTLRIEGVFCHEEATGPGVCP